MNGLVPKLLAFCGHAGGLHSLKCIEELYEWEFKLLNQGIAWLNITVLFTEMTQVITIIGACMVPGISKACTSKITP